MPEWKEVLDEAGRYAVRYLEGLPARPVGSNATLESLRAALDLPLPAQGTDPREVIAELARHADPGVVASSSGRFFGFVIGGATPAALAADWLTSVWDQNAGLYVLGPAAAVVEDVAARWLATLLGLPAGVSAGFVTGAQMANLTGLAIGLGSVLGRAGWNVAADGLWGAPRVRVLAGQGRHGTIDRALRFLGAGTGSIVEVGMDDQGRMRPAELRTALAAGSGPAIVCAQAGNVNSGAFDPVGEICDLAHADGAWVHVDGAFGLWAAASPRLRHLVAGVERADSWATDAHKWLNVPYDSGLVFCADPVAHRTAMGTRAGYLIHGAEGERDALDYGPEHSRRARGFAVYAAIRALGSDGVADLVERCCDLAARFAERLTASGRATILGEVVLNQVLVRFADDHVTRSVIEKVQREGTCWMSGTTWRGQAAMRISVSNWSTTPQDVDRSVAAILRCL
ncbi:aminotransferase class V-fold PLP-dependent enzyme [Actinoplanes sp. KI2]|uniref:pyridoxal phosphate-dependent decarboxylase family protein n=1 Tax=Actinoplanes sp. KI2 TaxID=2983315 RepID=UPI0021D5AFD0|nr:aminotransferase class V-fold PLP-dependent enzyme [Actinoplanes sp. KI2]MCU7727055.1 aminotransferase class V-fold PLP-dependent enzyme [Actinoplanes sp. KI2]